MINKFTLKFRFVGALAIALLMYSCGSETPVPDKHDEQAVEKKTEEDVVSPTITKFKGEIFSVPSPIQVAIILKEANVGFNEDLLNDVSKSKQYVSQFQKALNMGVYGTDLAYVSTYQKNQAVLEYFSSVKGLADELGIRFNVDEEIMVRFGSNVDNIDSLYVLTGEIYQEANNYLNENDQDEVASLILTGGWVESMHMMINGITDAALVKQKIGEQKSALRSLVKLLNVYDDEKVKSIQGSLKVIKNEIDAIEYKYSYIEPIEDDKKKTTYLKSRTTVNMTDESLVSIKTKLSDLRNDIIN